MEILVNCGKGLTRAPLIALEFGENGLYGLRQDLATAQYLLNIIKQTLIGN